MSQLKYTFTGYIDIQSSNYAHTVELIKDALNNSDYNISLKECEIGADDFDDFVRVYLTDEYDACNAISALQDYTFIKPEPEDSSLLLELLKELHKYAGKTKGYHTKGISSKVHEALKELPVKRVKPNSQHVVSVGVNRIYNIEVEANHPDKAEAFVRGVFANNDIDDALHEMGAQDLGSVDGQEPVIQYEFEVAED